MPQQVDERVSFLRQLPFFRDMLMKELAAVGFRCRMKSYVRDSIIMSEGTEAKGLYIIKKGIVSITKRSRSGEKVLARLREPNFFGEMSLLDRQPTSATVTALEDCECLVMEPRAFDELIASEPVVGLQLMLVIGRVMAHRLRHGGDMYGVVVSE